VGIGAKYLINEKWSVFGELRGLRDFNNNDNHDGLLFGFIYKFQQPKAPVVLDSDHDGVADYLDKCPNTPAGVKVDQNGCPVDSDHDGVADYLDKCPNTPAGVKVDQNGCPVDSDRDGVADYLDKCPNTPAGVKVDQNGCPVDSDHDGVADYLDKCPNTPAGVKVDQNGCPVDSDHDGVPDYLDKCPNTPKGFNVDKNGCPVTFNFAIHFDNNSAKIKPEYMEKIKEFAEFLKQNPNVKAEIQGYTDNRGSAVYNQKLSQRRAKAVYEALIKLGIDKNRLSYKGYGEANPIAPNDTPEGREKNRRVVAKLIF
jgi:OOP family OmpA-OmpF porin